MAGLLSRMVHDLRLGVPAMLLAGLLGLGHVLSAIVLALLGTLVLLLSRLPMSRQRTSGARPLPVLLGLAALLLGAGMFLFDPPMRSCLPAHPSAGSDRWLLLQYRAGTALPRVDLRTGFVSDDIPYLQAGA